MIIVPARLCSWLAAAILPLWLLLAAGPVAAAEVLVVSDADLLQVGDQNRSGPVILACIKVENEQRDAARDWLRRQLPRRTRVNLRPLGERDGVLVARVSLIRDNRQGGVANEDLSEGLIAAGVAQAAPCQP